MSARDLIATVKQGLDHLPAWERDEFLRELLPTLQKSSASEAAERKVTWPSRTDWRAEVFGGTQMSFNVILDERDE